MPRSLPQDPHELVVLAVLADESLYGYAIAKRVSSRTEDMMKLTPGVLYPLLKRLEREGLVRASWETVRSDRAEPGGDGRRRRWYTLTPKGHRRLAQRVEAHREYYRALEWILSSQPAAEGGL